MAFGIGLSPAADDLGSTAWQTYTPTVGGVAAGATVYATYRRIGETYDISIAIGHNGATTGQITVSLPATMNRGPSAVGSPSGWTPIGTAIYYDASASKRYEGIVVALVSSYDTAACTMQSAATGQIVAATTLPDGAAYAAGDTTHIVIRCATV